MHKLALVALISLGVAGCSRPYVTGSNENGVTVWAKSSYSGRALELAQNQCEAYGRTAVLSGTDSKHYIFKCLDNSEKQNFPTEQAAIASEKALWDEVKQSNTADDYKAYLEQYPRGTYTALAQSRISKLLNNQQTPQPREEPIKSGTIIHDCPECPVMVIIPPGVFEMGNEQGESNEKPVHQVTISKPFAIGKTEVIQGLWRKIMGNNPSKFSKCGDDCPVERVSWDDAKDFINRLNAKTGKKYRLPSEAEWEYACKGGVTNNLCEGGVTTSTGWIASNSDSRTHTQLRLNNQMPLGYMI